MQGQLISVCARARLRTNDEDAKRHRATPSPSSDDAHNSQTWHRDTVPTVQRSKSLFGPGTTARADREKRRRNRCGVPWYTTLLPVSGLYCTNMWGVEEHFRILVPRDLKGPGPTVDKAKAEGKGRSVRAVARARRDRPVRWTPGMLTRTYSRPLCGRRGVRRHLFSETGTYILSTHYTHSHTSSRST